MKALLFAIALLSSVALAQPNICGIEGPPEPDSEGCQGDPVSLLTGFSFHDPVDIAIDTGRGPLVLKRYFMPIGALGGSKSPLVTVIGSMWPTGAPQSPFGRTPGEERPVWSHDIYSFVAPCPTAGSGCLGADAGMSLVFEPDFHWTIFNRDGGTGVQAPHRKNPGTALRLYALIDGYRLIRVDGQQWFYRKLMGADRNTAPVLLTEVRDPLGQLIFSVAYPTTGCSFRASGLTFATGAQIVFDYDVEIGRAHV